MSGASSPQSKVGLSFEGGMSQAEDAGFGNGLTIAGKSRSESNLATLKLSDNASTSMYRRCGGTTSVGAHWTAQTFIDNLEP